MSHGARIDELSLSSLSSRQYKHFCHNGVMIADINGRFGIAHNRARGRLPGGLPIMQHDSVDAPIHLNTPIQGKIACAVKAVEGARLHAIAMTGGALAVCKPFAVERLLRLLSCLK